MGRFLSLLRFGQEGDLCYNALMKKLLFLILIAAPALAEGTNNRKTTECYCTDRTGSRIELGEMICLQVDGRMFMAQCQMSLNNPMWREISEGCLSSSLQQQSEPLINTSGIHAEI